MRKVVRRIVLSRRGQSRLAGATAIDLGVKFASLDDAVGTLSGGNQQKVVLGKSLAADVKVFLLDEPTRGVDIDAKHQIYALLERLAQQGTAILVASSEAEEPMLFCDRLLLLRDGRSVDDRTVANTTLAEVMSITMGSKNEITREAGT